MRAAALHSLPKIFHGLILHTASADFYLQRRRKYSRATCHPKPVLSGLRLKNFHPSIPAKTKHCSAFQAYDKKLWNRLTAFHDPPITIKNSIFSFAKSKKIVKKPKNYLHIFFSSLQLAPISNKNH